MRNLQSYHIRYAKQLADVFSIDGRECIVLGCGHGQDCDALVNLGASSVTGVDIDPNIGINSQSPRTTFLRQSIYETNLDKLFDLVYSVAVFEHLNDLQAAFRVASALCKPGGAVYIISSPLWHSPFGHHNNKIQQLPWIHLFASREEATDLMVNICGLSGDEAKLAYQAFNHPSYFNRQQPGFYKLIAGSVFSPPSYEIVWNSLWPAPELSSYKQADYCLNRCLESGFTSEVLLSSGHCLLALKRGSNATWQALSE
jgi:SAM-dependent methyltransferase